MAKVVGVKLKDGQAAQFQRAALAAGSKTIAAWLRDLGAQAVAAPAGDLQRQAATPTAHAGGTQNSTGGLDSVLRNGLKLEALKAKLGVKTLAQVEAGEAAKPLPIRGNTFTSVQGAVIDVGNAPVEDVPTVSWRERLTKAQQKMEVEGDYESMQNLLAGIKLPGKWISLSMAARIIWLDSNHPLEA
jgi:hypothetical protein